MTRISSLAAICSALATPAAAQQNIVDPTVAGRNQLLGMVQVGGGCSGMLIAADTVLTAAHCVCEDSYYWDNACDSTATVTFRDDPEQPSVPRRVMTGTVTAHPGYDPSWLENHIEFDFAIIKLDGVAPAHAKPFPVARGYLPVGANALVAGFGLTGADCSVSSHDDLNIDVGQVRGYEDGHDIMWFWPRIFCEGDSGGAILSEQGDRLYGVHSMHAYKQPYEGLVNKSNATGSAFDWIKSHMCLSSATNYCETRGDPCTCSGTSNIVWQNTSGQLAIWTMNAETIQAQAYPGTVGNDWQIKGSGDFNGDTQGDILWRHVSGQVAIWFMNNGAIIGQGYPAGQDPYETWKIQGTGDFDGDTRADILWRHTSGQLAIWFAGESDLAAYPGRDNVPAPVDNSWKVSGIGDFNGDANADILWRHTNGQVAIWTMSGATRLDETYPEPQDPSHFWKVQGVGDFDGNLHSDILWRSDTGQLAIWFDGVSRFDPLMYQNKPGNLEASWQLQAIADFNHDGRDDILWRGANGQPSLWLVDGARFVGDVYPVWADNSWQIKGLLRN